MTCDGDRGANEDKASKLEDPSAKFDLQISVLIPTYMEAESLPELVERIETALNGASFEIVVIDDNSPDGTAEVASRLSERFGNIRVVSRPGKMGLGSAVVEGLRVARSRFVAVMDADLQHPPEILPQMLRKLMEGYDVVIASRFVAGGGVEGLSSWRKLVSKGATLLAHISLSKSRGVADPLSGYFAFDKAAIGEAELNPIGYKILLEVLAKGNYKSVFELPYTFERRAKGKSKLGLREMLRYLKHLYALVRETKEYRRPINFVLVGLVGIFVNEGLLWLLTERLGLYYLISAAVGSEVSILSNFALNELFTFRDLTTDVSPRSELIRAFQYNWTRVVGMWLGLLTLFALTMFLGLHYLLANLLGIAVGLAWGYATSITIVWKG